MAEATYTRRRLLATIGTLAGTGTIAGCSGVLDGSDDESDAEENASHDAVDENGTDADAPADDGWVAPPDAADEWETRTENDADVTVDAPDALDLRVHQCSTAEASTRIADGTGTLRIAFDYETEAEQWYEGPRVYVVEDGEERGPLEEGSAALDVEEYDTVEGSVDTTVDVDGAVDLSFRIEPSDHCGNGDHANTFLRIRNLVVEEAASN